MIKKNKDSKGRVLKPNEREKIGIGYEYRYTDKIGKRKSIFAKNLDDLRKREDQIIANSINGKVVNNDALTVNDMFLKWKEVKEGLRTNTFNNYVYMYERFIAKSIGKAKLKDLVRSDIKAFYKELVKKEYMKANTVDSIHSILHQVLELAVDDDIIRYNPADKALKEIKKSSELQNEEKVVALTVTQELELLSFLKHDNFYKHWYPLIKYMLRTGERVGEVTCLQKKDIDYEKNIINVNKTLVYYDKKDGKKKGLSYEIHQPKTKAGNRYHVIMPCVKEALELEEQYLKDAEITCKSNIQGYDDFVFVNRFGNVFNQSTINKALKAMIKKCNEQILMRDKGKQDNLIPKISAHKLRKSFATRTTEAGITEKARHFMLGHSDEDLTNKVYTDVTMELMVKEYKKLSDYYDEIEKEFNSTKFSTNSPKNKK